MFFLHINLLNADFTKWSNTLKQFVDKLPTNCLSVFDHFVGLALKGLNWKWNEMKFRQSQVPPYTQFFINHPFKKSNEFQVVGKSQKNTKNWWYNQSRWEVSYGRSICTIATSLVLSQAVSIHLTFNIQVHCKSEAPFAPNAPFLYPLKTSENPEVEKKGCIGNEWIKVIIAICVAYHDLVLLI